MEEILKLQQKIIPEMMELMQKRYNILRNIYYNQPVGRRILARNLELSERVVRTEINFLKDQNFIEITLPGMIITSEGEEIIDKLKNFIHEIKGLSELEKSIKKKLGVKSVIIVPGSLDEDSTVMKELGRAAANYLKSVLVDDQVVAITGGSTVKDVIDNVPKMNNLNQVMVVPARGGMGRNLQTQANTLVSNLANKLNCNYRLLHVPDNLSNEAVNAMMKEKSVKDILTIIHSSDILIYGIGRANDMARRRGLSKEEIDNLVSKGAVGEAFGYYFNRQGDVIYSTPTMGIKKEQISNINHLIAVAGGECKAEAIISTEINNANSVLITDEGAARRILKLFNNSEL
ncbi:central glycolytic genes regulator [Clostridium tetanomorphum]|uniref:Sugar-binding transcriptional regulator n=1 Tax=Clostridium tetanomorphum TaxID=1553 RepID=A0A923J1E6_CLOTT|nr:sugar-binding transcriptional regulator [Clostridium tetanomorphum]KAJ50396.1 central glycolytic genes regulator [Clostridium tetanomorphum DSM 665]MBC2398709.1 sugar-binding transcriptional regulator [Clostridium tetanomorphum]MBP1865790.1 central glycolytic genes regulator [Clostridium tetanomorphum]NRS86911.1 central glycolytic genes regulator [Clostridium tetanomorphum]NRZ99331.1 central glycolytic genes regulator [Clostridium tetanomorphum]